MRGLIIMKGSAIAQITAAGVADLPMVLTPDPKEVCQASAIGTATINVDLGAVTEIDTVFAGFSNAAAGATWAIDRTTSMAGANPVAIHEEGSFRTPGRSSSRHHAVALFNPVATRFLRLRITQPAGADPLQLGVLMIGARFEHAYEFKAGRRPIDLSERADLASGGFGFGRGAIKSSFRFTFADLDDAELDELWHVIAEVGNQHPVMLIEGGAGDIVFDQVHYGVFERFEPYEREDPADTRWALSMVDWI